MKKLALITLTYFLVTTQQMFAYSFTTPIEKDSSIIGYWKMADFLFDDDAKMLISYSDSEKNLAIRERLDRLVKETSYRFFANGKVGMTKINIKKSKGAVKSSGTWEVTNKEGKTILVIKESNGEGTELEILKIKGNEMVLREVSELTAITGRMLFKKR